MRNLTLAYRACCLHDTSTYTALDSPFSSARTAALSPHCTYILGYIYIEPPTRLAKHNKPASLRKEVAAPGMKALAVIPIGHIDASIPGDRMRIDGCSGVNAVFPFLLHLRMHHE